MSGWASGGMAPGRSAGPIALALTLPARWSLPRPAGVRVPRRRGLGTTGSGPLLVGHAPPPGRHARGREASGRTPGRGGARGGRYKPAVLARAGPVGRCGRCRGRGCGPVWISGYAGRRTGRLLVLGGIDDDRGTWSTRSGCGGGHGDFGIVAAAPQSFAWLGRGGWPCRRELRRRLHPGMVDPVARRVLSRRRLRRRVTRRVGDRMVLLSTARTRSGRRGCWSWTTGAGSGGWTCRRRRRVQPPPTWTSPAPTRLPGGRPGRRPRGRARIPGHRQDHRGRGRPGSLQTPPAACASPCRCCGGWPTGWYRPPRPSSTPHLARRLLAGEGCWLCLGQRDPGAWPSPRPAPRWRNGQSGISWSTPGPGMVRPSYPAAAAASWQEGRLLASRRHLGRMRPDDWAGGRSHLAGCPGAVPRGACSATRR